MASTRTGHVGAMAFAVAAALGTTVATAAPPAHADDPKYPSWDDVERARANQQATQAQIAQIQGLLADLQKSADDYNRIALQKGEIYNQALDALDAATAKAEDLQKQAKAASDRADASARRVGALIAQLARQGGGDPTIGLVFDDSKGGDMLARLGTLSKLSTQSSNLYETAVRDRNLARSLTLDAQAAEKQRQAQFEDAKKALADAQSAAQAAETKVQQQQSVQDTLYAQLATLKGTTASVEAAYQQGQLAQQQKEEEQRRAAAAAQQPTRSSGGTTSNGSSSGGSGSSGSGSSGSGSAPAASVGAPNGNAVAGAIAFAKAQLGLPYVFAGTGNPGWDCSGLTLYSYKAVGIYIGTHSATNQYNTMRAQGKLVPLAQMQPGDLLWYTTTRNGSDMYHVTMYIGGGQMIEAPHVGAPVRIVPVRYGDLWYQAGRPAA